MEKPMQGFPLTPSIPMLSLFSPKPERALVTVSIAWKVNPRFGMCGGEELNLPLGIFPRGKRRVEKPLQNSLRTVMHLQAVGYKIVHLFAKERLFTKG